MKGFPSDKVSFMRLILALAAALTLSGCMTVEDFLDMPDAARAEYVCAKTPGLSELDDELDKLRTRYRTAEDNLARGYAVHRDCRDVRVPVSEPPRNCRRDHHGRTICDPPRTRIETRCRELPVAIDSRLEQSKSADARRRYDEVKARRDALYRSCYDKAVLLPPQQAFWYWDNGLIPQ